MKRTNVPKKELILFENNARNRVLRELFKYSDKEYSLSDLAKETNVPKSNIGDIINNMFEAGAVTIKKLAKIWRIKANQENKFFIISKIVFNLNYIYQNNIVEFLNDLYKNPRVIILFGSFRFGRDITGSDIDIAIETGEEVAEGYKVLYLKQLNEIANNKANFNFVSNFEKNIGREIQIHIFNRKFKEKIDINVFNNIANGIVLSGFLEVNP